MNNDEIAESIIKDLKSLFRFQAPNKLTKQRTIFIPENKAGLLKYILIANLEKSQTDRKVSK